MWVSNAFFEWTHVKSSTSEGRRQFLRNLWQDVEHYTLQQAHIIVLLIMQLTAKTQLILQDVIHMSITKWTQGMTISFFPTCPVGQVDELSTCPSGKTSCPCQILKINHFD